MVASLHARGTPAKIVTTFLPTLLSATLKRAGASVRARDPLERHKLTHLRRHDDPTLMSVNFKVYHSHPATTQCTFIYIFV